MARYAIFNDEGCIDREFGSVEDAQDRAAEFRDLAKDDEDGGDPSAYAAEECPDHDEQPKDSCEDCEADDGDEDGED